MEAKLKEYRARRRRQELVEKTTEQFENTKRRFVELFKKMIKINVDEPEEELAPAFKEVARKEPGLNKTLLEEEDYEEDFIHNSQALEEKNLIELDSEVNEDEVSDEKSQKTWLHIILKWSLFTLIWIVLYFYFITLQFGAVFFAISLLVGIYLNTGTRPKKKGEASAYSVFNENCESIDGTVTAEKLQREMFFGSFRLF